MLIQEVCKRTGFSRDTIRYYEKIGLIKIHKKQRRQNNYKEYPEEVIERLGIIQRARHLGFTLNEIGSLIESWLSKSLTKEERIGLFKSRIDLIDQKIDKLNEIRSYLQERINQVKKEK